MHWEFEMNWQIVIKVDAFKKQMKDIIEYRTMEYYRRRYIEN